MTRDGESSEWIRQCPGHAMCITTVEGADFHWTCTGAAGDRSWYALPMSIERQMFRLVGSYKCLLGSWLNLLDHENKAV